MSIKLLPGTMITQGLERVGGATSSLFPTVESLLNTHDEYSWAIQVLAPHREKIGEYRSLLDFLFCELNPQYREACRRFYGGSGKPLRALLKESKIEVHHRQMIIALEVARQNLKTARQRSWGWYQEEIERQLAA